MSCFGFAQTSLLMIWLWPALSLLTVSKGEGGIPEFRGELFWPLCGSFYAALLAFTNRICLNDDVPQVFQTPDLLSGQLQPVAAQQPEIPQTAVQAPLQPTPASTQAPPQAAPPTSVRQLHPPDLHFLDRALFKCNPFHLCDSRWRQETPRPPLVWYWG